MFEYTNNLPELPAFFKKDANYMLLFKSNIAM